jgi:hypothetical protein
MMKKHLAQVLLHCLRNYSCNLREENIGKEDLEAVLFHLHHLLV